MAIAQGYRNDNPAGDALTAALPKRPAPVRHQRALPHGEVAGAVATVCASAAWAGLKLVFEFLVLTATRSAEARLATWEEMELTRWCGPYRPRERRRDGSTECRCAKREVEILDEPRNTPVGATMPVADHNILRSTAARNAALPREREQRCPARV